MMSRTMLGLLLGFVGGILTGAMYGSTPLLRRALLAEDGGRVMGAVLELESKMKEMEAKMKEMEAIDGNLSDRLETCTCQRDANGDTAAAESDGQRRRAQRDTVGAENARILRRQVTTINCPAHDGRFGLTECQDPAFEACHREACVSILSGHRRMQAAAGEPCSASTLARRTAAVNSACCSSVADCTNGHPVTCSTACAATFLPWWRDCEVALGKDGRMFEAAVELCEAADGTGASVAMQLGVECTDASVVDGDCIPECTEELHGFIMLLSVDGDDVKYSCQLHHLLYSWIGGSSDGGYLGSDHIALLSAMLSAAPGLYALALLETAGVSVDLTVTPGMTVTITGDTSLPTAPLWGVDYNTCGRANNEICEVFDNSDPMGEHDSIDGFTHLHECAIGTDDTDCGIFHPTVGGGFIVSDEAELSLVYIDLSGSSGLTLRHGGSLSLTFMTVTGPWLAAAMIAFDGKGNSFQMNSITVPQYLQYGNGTDDRLWHTSEIIAGSDTKKCCRWLNAGDDKRTHCTDPEMVDDSGVPATTACPVACRVGTPVVVLTQTTLPDPDQSKVPVITGSVTVNGDGTRTRDGSLIYGQPTFVITGGQSCLTADMDSLQCLTFGPPLCTVSAGGRCVGRPGGYYPSESCIITVVGGGGFLGECGVFDNDNEDDITFPNGKRFNHANCPAGEALAQGDSITWTSDFIHQGGGAPGSDTGCNVFDSHCPTDSAPGQHDGIYHAPNWSHNSCRYHAGTSARMDSCGARYSLTGLGGGWQLCF
jgi:hypothetical protein